MTTSEPGPAEREEQLAAMRKKMSRALRRGETAEYDRLKAAYASLKAAHVTKVHEERIVKRRAAREAREALVAQQRAEEAPKRWRLPRGFSSPLAAERARSGWQERREPVRPARGLRPWRQGSPMQERVWTPGR